MLLRPRRKGNQVNYRCRGRGNQRGEGWPCSSWDRANGVLSMAMTAAASGFTG